MEYLFVQVCSSLVHIIELVTVEDLQQLGSLVTDKYNILAVHLTKYVSLAGDQSEKGLRNVNPFVVLHFICHSWQTCFILLLISITSCCNNMPDSFLA